MLRLFAAMGASFAGALVSAVLVFAPPMRRARCYELDFSLAFAIRALTAFLAMSERCFALNLFPRSLPPSAPVARKKSRTSFGNLRCFFATILGPKISRIIMFVKGVKAAALVEFRACKN